MSTCMILLVHILFTHQKMSIMLRIKLLHLESDFITLIKPNKELSAQNFVLTISLKKTEVLCPPLPQEAYSPRISINGDHLNTVEHFTYLESVISIDATVSEELDNDLSTVGCCFGKLPKRIWHCHCLHLSMKIQVYRAVIVWVLYQKQIRLLEWFHQHCLCSILGIK